MNEYALKRRRPYHTGEEYFGGGPAFGAPNYSHGPSTAMFFAPEASGASDLYMPSPEEHFVTDQAVAAAIFNSLDLTATFDPAFCDFGNIGTAVGDIQEAYIDSTIPFPNPYTQLSLVRPAHPPAPPPPQPPHHPPPNPRKRQRSDSDQGMPRLLYKGHMAEKTEWTTATSNMGDPSCSDNLMACFPAGALAKWKDFYSSYAGDSHSHEGYQELPQNAGAYGDSGRRPMEHVLSEPPEAAQMVASPPHPPPYTQAYRVAPLGAVSSAGPELGMVRFLPCSERSEPLPVSAPQGVYPTHTDSHLALQPAQTIPTYQFQGAQADLALLNPYLTPTSGATAAPVTMGALVPAYHASSPPIALASREHSEAPIKHKTQSIPVSIGYETYPQAPLVSAPVSTSGPPARTTEVVPHKHKPMPTRRGPFKDTAAREKTAQTRKMGSCIRCKMQRIRCEFDENTSDFGPCITCQKVSSTKIWRVPCLRYKLTDIQLHKPGQVQGYEWTSRWKDRTVENITSWSSNDFRYIEVSQAGMPVPLRLRVRQFLPQPGDKLKRTWKWKGVVREVDVPPYAIADLDSVEGQYLSMIEGGVTECLKSIVDGQPSLLERTYMHALMLSRDPNTSPEDRDLLIQAIRLWVAVRLGTRSDVIVSRETLGMPHDIMDETSPLHGQIPLPPVMGAQLDLVLTRQLIPRLRKSLLLQLQKISQANQARNWLVMYLVFFILLDNASLLFLHDRKYVEKHGIAARFAREDTVREYHLGANIILAYFHYCNKGIYPFSAACKDDELKTLADLDDGWVQFVKYTRTEVQRMKGEWAAVRERKEYSHHFYFTSQMFEEQWQPKGIE